MGNNKGGKYWYNVYDGDTLIGEHLLPGEAAALTGGESRKMYLTKEIGNYRITRTWEEPKHTKLDECRAFAESLTVGKTYKVWLTDWCEGNGANVRIVRAKLVGVYPAFARFERTAKLGTYTECLKLWELKRSVIVED